MAGIKVEIEGLIALKERFSSKSLNKALVPVLGQAANKLHSEIRNAVVNKYSVSSNEVNSILENKSISNLKFGQNFVEQSLNYRFKAKRLSTFPFVVSRVTLSKPARFMVPDNSRFSGYSLRKKYWAERVDVRIKRSNGYKTVVGKRGFGGFYQKRSDTNPNSNIFERRQEETWIIEPEIRAPIEALYGPSVSQMINSVLTKDLGVQNELDSLTNFIGDNLKL